MLNIFYSDESLIDPIHFQVVDQHKDYSLVRGSINILNLWVLFILVTPLVFKFFNLNFLNVSENKQNSICQHYF